MNGRSARPVLLLALALAACDSGSGPGTTPVDPAEPVETAEVSMTIARLANSAVPSQADSALVRVWHATAGTNQVKAVAIPAPGTTNSVSFTVPVRTGYSVGVIAYRGERLYQIREALAAGEASNVAVAAGQANTVAVNVVPWQFAVAGPDTLVSGEPASYTFTATQGVHANFLAGANLMHATRPLSDTTASPTYTFSGYDTANKRYTYNIVTPTVSADSAVYMRMYIAINATDWQLGSPMVVKSPSPQLAVSQLRRPIKLGAGSITVTFDRNATR